MIKRTKIVCTIGPASESKEKITAMVRAGMNVARLNFSHGTYENHTLLIKNIREVEMETGEPIAIMQDLRGPKIRVGNLPEAGVELKEKETVVFDTASTEYKKEIIPIDFVDLCSFVKPDERILFSDGRIEVKITAVKGSKITAIVIVSGVLFSQKGINVPDSHFTGRALTEKDKADAKFGLNAGVDLMAMSFVTDAEDVLDLKYLIKQIETELGHEPDQPVRIIAKIERAEAVKNIAKILEVADGIMVARGDLGIEIPAQKVPLVQKQLVDLALQAGKPVIVATQMLDSMQENPRPTRAEVSDVANAVIDHTDAVMLSNETASGKYPVQSVETMAAIIQETEHSVYDNLVDKENNEKLQAVEDVISGLSKALAEKVGAKIILAASLSGETGRLISRHRPELPIVVATGSERVKRQLNLSWGVIPFVLIPCRTIEELVERSIVYLKENKIIKKKEKLIVVAGEPVGEAGNVNLLEVRTV